jgi:uncharacterized membrane protein YbhN (UPF0104 family)
VNRRALSLVLTVCLLLVLGYLARGHVSELRRLKDVPLSASAVILSLFLLARLAGAEIVKTGLARLGHEIGRAECFMLAIVTSYTNLFVPRTGLAPPALYLRHRYGVAYTSYLSLVVANVLIATVAVGVLGVVLHLTLSARAGWSLRADALALFGLVALAAAAALLGPGRLFRFIPPRLREALAQAHRAWIRLAGSWTTLGRIVALQLASIVLRAIRLRLAFEAAGEDVSFPVALFVSLCADLGSLVSLTPAALGFREGAMVFGASWVGLTTGAALLAAIIDRVICTAGLVVLGQLFVWKGLRGIAQGGPEPGER